MTNGMGSSPIVHALRQEMSVPTRCCGFWHSRIPQSMSHLTCQWAMISSSRCCHVLKRLPQGFKNFAPRHAAKLRLGNSDIIDLGGSNTAIVGRAAAFESVDKCQVLPFADPSKLTSVEILLLNREGPHRWSRLVGPDPVSHVVCAGPAVEVTKQDWIGAV
eukprot:344413-Pyramimonas_sp.AAC.1